MAKHAPKLAQEARLAFEAFQRWFKPNIDQYHEFMTFVLGSQWTDDEQDLLKTYRKVPLTVNKLASMANSLLAEQQSNTPQLVVEPGPGCDEQTASLRETITKSIMFSPCAREVYETAAKQAIIGGFSAYLLDTEYENDGFDLVPVYRDFRDPTKCFWDISSEHHNKIDSLKSGYVQMMSRERFSHEFGESVERKITSRTSLNNNDDDDIIDGAIDSGFSPDVFVWADEKVVAVLHYYKVKFKKDTKYRLSDRTEIDQEEMDALVEASIEINSQLAELNPEAADTELLWKNNEPVRIEDSRTISKPYVKHYKIAGQYIIEESIFPSNKCPLIFVDQSSYYMKDGKQVCRPFFVDAKDTQRYINYLRTQSAHILKVSRYDQYMGSKKNVASNDTQNMWRDPSTMQGMLLFDESPGGYVPQKLSPPELSQSLTIEYEKAIQDLYTCTGLYPTYLGQQGQEVSGVAINRRDRIGAKSIQPTLREIDKAVTAGGNVLNEMIPRIYDSERVIALESSDYGRTNVTVNKQTDEFGEVIENDITKGTYQVKLVAGPSTEGQKQDALESLDRVIQHDPALFRMFGDLYAENLPLDNTLQIKNRLKTIVPPQIIEAGKTGRMPEQAQQPPDPQQVAAQQAAEAQKSMMQLKQQELALKAKELEMKMSIELQKLQIEQAEIAAQLEEQQLRYAGETHRANVDEVMNHANNLTTILTHNVKEPTHVQKQY